MIKGKGRTMKGLVLSVCAVLCSAVTVFADTFDGFVGVRRDGEFAGCGTLMLAVAGNGKLKVKIVTASGTCSVSAPDWDSLEGGKYVLRRTTNKGQSLDLAFDATAAWDANQLTGTYAAGGKTYEIRGQRRVFDKVWYFAATGDSTNGWTLAYAPNAKSAALTVKVKSNGKTSLAGKLDGMRVSASGMEDVSGLRDGAILADFLPKVSVKTGRKSVRKLLYVRTNLWFDRRLDHEEGVGTAKFAD